mmetsp:Transcript_8562/g.27448  ORF Transcript_8562/g.27448 Transcript_8562/m.27448 type:complete len:219 (+) Transcript_8562:405-1061(+)
MNIHASFTVSVAFCVPPRMRTSSNMTKNVPAGFGNIFLLPSPLRPRTTFDINFANGTMSADITASLTSESSQSTSQHLAKVANTRHLFESPFPFIPKLPKNAGALYFGYTASNACANANAAHSVASFKQSRATTLAAFSTSFDVSNATSCKYLSYKVSPLSLSTSAVQIVLKHCAPLAVYHNLVQSSVSPRLLFSFDAYCSNANANRTILIVSNFPPE